MRPLVLLNAHQGRLGTGTADIRESSQTIQGQKLLKGFAVQPQLLTRLIMYTAYRQLSAMTRRDTHSSELQPGRNGRARHGKQGSFWSRRQAVQRKQGT